MIQSTSGEHAKEYFSNSLSQADYYINDQELNGSIQGRLADRLGLTGPATKSVFFSLCENINPNTDKPLTPMVKKVRRVGYDINFHCPKSVSILHALGTDDHLLEVFQNTVNEVMKHIETDSQTRVRKHGEYGDRPTGELLWADFVHQTARPVEGSLPDPHLHAHCFVFNATWDDIEKKVKAGQFGDIKRDMPYYQARFHKIFSDKLIGLGYAIRRTNKSFEIAGVPENVIDLFSKRTDEIDQFAKANGIKNAKELDELGARTRSPKQKGTTMAELRADWRRQIRELTSNNDAGSQSVRFAKIANKPVLLPQECVDHAVDDGFERASVLPERRILATAYRYAIGNDSVSVENINVQFESDKRIIHVQEKSKILCTTQDVLQEEQLMVNLARQGQGKLLPLYSTAPITALAGQQAEAVEHVLTTTNHVSIIRGAAGTGKTTLMKEAVKWMENSGKTVTVVAPTSQASRGVLREEGFADAETVTKLLTDIHLQDQLRGQILWVDEAGLLGTREMVLLLELVQKQNCRLILGGDTRQHASVVRGDALRILNTVAGIHTAEVSKIYRQKNEYYKIAVENLSKGDVSQAFSVLNKMGAILAIDPLKPNDRLVSDYVAALKKRKSALIISPTHQQAEEITKDIRNKLRAVGLLGKKEFTGFRLINTNLTSAQKSDWRNFEKGQYIQFNQNLPDIMRGSLWVIDDSSQNGVLIRSQDNKIIPLPLENSNHFEQYLPGKIALSKGDRIRITRNGFDSERNRINNGQLLSIKSVRKNGEIILQNSISMVKYKLESSFGHLTHAHCITSYASQGKTVDEVFISQPSSTFGATDAKQFYVSVSRGRDRAHIYTDDKEQLLENASQIGDRQSAIELINKKKQTQELVNHQIRQDLPRSQKENAKPKDVPKSSIVKNRDYEPGI